MLIKTIRCKQGGVYTPDFWREAILNPLKSFENDLASVSVHTLYILYDYF